MGTVQPVHSVFEGHLEPRRVDGAEIGHDRAVVEGVEADRGNDVVGDLGALGVDVGERRDSGRTPHAETVQPASSKSGSAQPTGWADPSTDSTKSLPSVLRRTEGSHSAWRSFQVPSVPYVTTWPSA